MNRKRLSRILILSGVLCLVAALGYEAASFPWRIYFGAVDQAVAPPRAPETILRDVDFIPWEPQATEPATRAGAVSQAILPGSDSLITPAATIQEHSAATEAAAVPAPRPRYAVMGTLAIPALGVSENIISGTGDELRAGVGHMTGTALPGESGNCALAGHRNYVRMHPFRHLDKLQVGDTVTVTLGDESYTYTVYEVGLIVRPADIWVVYPVEGRDKVLTLITCDPVVNPVNRLIIHAELT